MVEAAVDRYCVLHARLDTAAYEWLVTWNDRILPSYDVVIRERSAVDRLSEITRKPRDGVGPSG